MNNVMLTAVEARAKAQNDSVIFREVRSIEDAILSAVAAGQYEVAVTETTMTATVDPGLQTAIVYFNTWRGLGEDRAKYVQMNNVITYFKDLGYSIERRTNSHTGSTFKWVISW